MSAVSIRYLVAYYDRINRLGSRSHCGEAQPATNVPASAAADAPECRRTASIRREENAGVSRNKSRHVADY